MRLSLRLFVSAVGAVIGVRLARSLYRLIYWRRFSPFRYMPGPPNPSWISGNFGRITFSKTQEWQARYGPTFRFHNLLSATTLYTIDTLALHRIVTHSDVYQKAPMARFHLKQLLGEGLVVAEDEEHTKLSPAFGPSQIHGLTQLFVDKSLELSDVWTRQPRDESGWARIDVFAGLKAMTLDVIGLAEPTELDGAFKQLFLQTGPRRIRATAVLRGRFPFLRPLLPTSKKLANARMTMDRIGMQLLQDSKNAIESGEKVAERRDLLSLLVRNQRLSDDVVVSRAQFPFNHPTATTWALYALAVHPDVQTTLRAELQTMGTDSPSLDALNSLPYLDKVVREVMRVHSPVAFTNRMAMRDDVIPLGTPYTDTQGKQHDSIVMSKGQMIYVPVAAVNRDPRIWGPDAAEFKPDRWDAVPEAANAIPGVWSHLFSFLGGPHNCIGWRFSLAEMKSLLYTLIRTFEFELAVPPEAIGTGTIAVQRPLLVAEPGKGAQLPMRVRRVQV
ncbi:cytochrome P450 [Mycena olivaceomarginata]|nr:cytochrome P450 [Mycena olivaceomarginata]